MFSVGLGGGLSQVSGSPFSLGLAPTAVAFSPSGGVLALGNSSTDAVPVYSVSAGGALTQVAGSPFPTSGRPAAVSFSANGRLLASAQYNTDLVSVFSVGAGGSLTPVPGSPLAAGHAPQAVAFSPGSGLLAAAESDALSVFSVRAPTAVIVSPAAGESYSVGQVVATSFSCADAAYGPGIASCQDSSGASAPSGRLDTATPGPHTYAVRATSIDGQSATTSIPYVVSSSPLGIGPVRMAGATATIRIACRLSPGQLCAGRILGTTRLRERKRSRVQTVTVVVARRGYSVAGGASSTVRVSLNTTGRRLLARRYRLPVALTFSGAGAQTWPVTFSYPRVKLPVHRSWVWVCGPGHCYTTVSNLAVDGLPTHATVVIVCRGRGCSFRHRTVHPRGRRLTLAAPAGADRLAPGTTLTLEITAPGRVGEVVIYTMKSGKFPAAAIRCLPPGARRPQRCVRGS